MGPQGSRFGLPQLAGDWSGLGFRVSPASLVKLGMQSLQPARPLEVGEKVGHKTLGVNSQSQGTGSGLSV